MNFVIGCLFIMSPVIITGIVISLWQLYKLEQTGRKGNTEAESEPIDPTKDWQSVPGHLYRLEIPEGYLYMRTSAHGPAMAFVPKEKK